MLETAESSIVTRYEKNIFQKLVIPACRVSFVL